MAKKKPQQNETHEEIVSETVSLSEFVEELEETPSEEAVIDNQKSIKEPVSKRNKSPVFHYRNILYTPSGLISPGISPRTLLDARRTYLDIMETTHGMTDTFDSLYEIYERSMVKRRADNFKSRNEFVTGLEKLVEMGIFEKIQIS